MMQETALRGLRRTIPFQTSNASFSPDSLFCNFPNSAHSLSPTSSAQEIHEYFESPTTLWFQARVEHERLHWVQGVGTSAGLRYLILRRIVSLLFVLFWDSLSNNSIRIMCEKRRLGIIPMNCELPHQENESTAKLLDCAKNLSALGEIMRFGSQDSINASENVRVVWSAFDQLISGQIEFRKFVGDVASIPPISYTGQSSSSVNQGSIEEGMALCSQMLFLVNFTSGAPLQLQTLKQIILEQAEELMKSHKADLSQLYTVALETFDREVPARPDVHTRDRLFMFLIAGDIALNPPFASKLQIHQASFASGDSSAYRFLRVAAFFRISGIRPPNFFEATSIEIDRFYTAVTVGAGLQMLPSNLDSTRQLTLPDSLTSQIPRICAIPLMLLTDAARVSNQLRAHVPHFFLSPSGTWLNARWSEIFAISDYDLAWRPPLLAVHGRTINTGLEERRFDEVVLSLLVQRILVDVCSSIGSPEFDDFPSDNRIDELRMQATLLIDDRYGGAFMY